MLFQETTPDTSSYMIAGYAITFLVLAVYVVSLYLRNRNLKQDMDMLAEMEKPAVKIQANPIGKAKTKKVQPGTKRGRK